MNALLQQQLLKYFGSVSTDDRQLQAFIAAVGEAYDRWQASKPYPIEPAQGDLPDFQAESGSEPATMNSDFSPFSVRRQRVLVADDNDVNRRMASLMLERLNCSADFARDGLEAVEAWERSRHDAILMDCQMPKMGGFEATLEIRRREAARDTSPADRVRIVALTANAFKGQREQCLAAQMDDYLSKPFDLAQLRATLMRNLKDWGSNADRRLAPDSGAAVFHPEKLSRLCTDLGKENVVAIVRSFTVELPGTVARLHEYSARGQWHEFARVAHSMQSIVATLGLAVLPEMFAELEGAAKKNGWTRFKPCFRPSMTWRRNRLPPSRGGYPPRRSRRRLPGHRPGRYSPLERPRQGCQ